MKKIALLGECMIELNGELFGSMRQTYGGDSSNTAVYLSRISNSDIDVFYVTAVGDDKISNMLIDHWNAEGVDTSLVMRDSVKTLGLYMIQNDEFGERSFSYWRNNSAAKDMVTHSLFASYWHQICDMDMVYLSGISLAILDSYSITKLFDYLCFAKSKGVKIAFDSNYRTNLWADESAAKFAYKMMFSIADVALVTEDDELELWSDSDTSTILKRIHSHGCHVIVLKKGSDGAILSVKEENNHYSQLIPTSPVQNIVDTTSAGDSFNAGFLLGYLTNQSLVESCKIGNSLAGKVIQHQGAIIPVEAME